MYALLRDAGKAAVEAIAEHGIGALIEMTPGGKAIFAIAKSWWQKIRLRRKIAEVRADVEQMVQASAEEVRAAAAQIAQEVASEEIREQIEVFLTEIPAAARQSFKRPEDVTGKSVPAGFSLQGEEDLAKLLPPRLPRFKSGDALPGRAGWVLEHHLSGGGFGEVWLARHGHFGMEGAVKFFRNLQERQRDLLHEGNVIARIRREAGHPNIVPLLDAHLDGDLPWLMFEYVDGGRTLADIIHRWANLPLPNRRDQVVVALQLLTKAVARFHGLTPPIVHRDLKPANILYDKNSKQLRITDFGIGGVAAGHMLESEKHGSLTRAARLQSYLYGSCTPLYASPEQKNGDPPDPRDDVHALGVIAYQMLTGQMTHGVGPDFADDLRDLDVEENLIELVRRCTARAQRRLKDAGEIAAMLATPTPPRQLDSAPFRWRRK